MKVVAWLAAAGIGMFLFHRLALWAESRGYIYYLKRKPSGSALGNAFLEVQSLIEPDKKALVEVIREEPSQEAESGDPPKPGEPAASVPPDDGAGDHRSDAVDASPGDRHG